MANLARIRVNWSGVVGGGVSTFYCNEADVATALAEVHDLFGVMAGFTVPSVTWNFETTGDVIDSATGTLIGAYSESSLTPITGSSSTGERAAGVGLRIRWLTGAVIGGRRIQGATYFTDLSVNNFAADGTLNNIILSTIQAGADAAVAAGVLGVWSRPGPSGSGFSTWANAVVPDRITALRSRRY